MIFGFGAIMFSIGESLFLKRKFLPFAQGLSVLAFLSFYSACGVMYKYDYSMVSLLIVSSIVILLNIGASYRYHMYMHIGMSIIASYILVTIMRVHEINGENFISAYQYVFLLVGIAALFSIASYMVFDRTKKSTMAFITVIITNLWLIIFGFQMDTEILAAGSIIMLLTMFLATGTAKMGFRGMGISMAHNKNNGVPGSQTLGIDFGALSGKQRRKAIYFQVLWYLSLFLSMVVCMVISLREEVRIPFGSYDLAGSGLTFGSAILAYAGSAVYLRKEVSNLWIFNTLTFFSGFVIGLINGSFWPIIISFTMVQLMILALKRSRYTWYTSLVFTMLMCIPLAVLDAQTASIGAYQLPLTHQFFGISIIVYSFFAVYLKREIKYPQTLSYVAFFTGLIMALIDRTFWPVTIAFVVSQIPLLLGTNKKVRSIWYGGLGLSLFLMIPLSYFDSQTMAIGSYQLPLSTLLFGGVLLFFSAVYHYLNWQFKHSWTLSVCAMLAGLSMGLITHTFWPQTIFLLLAQIPLLWQRERRSTWLSGFLSIMTLCLAVASEGRGAIVLGSLNVPSASLLFGLVLIIFTALAFHHRKNKIVPNWEFCVTSYIFVFLMGLISRSFLPYTLIFFVSMAAFLKMRNVFSGKPALSENNNKWGKYMEMFYPLGCTLLVVSYAISQEADLFNGLLGWIMLLATLGIFYWTRSRQPEARKKETKTFGLSLFVTALALGAITPWTSSLTAQVSILSIICMCMYLIHKTSKTLRGTKDGSSSTKAINELMGGTNPRAFLFTLVLVPGIYLVIYSFSHLLGSFDYIPLMNALVFLVPVFAYFSYRKLPSWIAAIPSTIILLFINGFYIHEGLETASILTVLFATAIFAAVHILRKNDKLLETGQFGSLRSSIDKFTASWLVFPVFLLLIVMIGGFYTISPYIFWFLVLVSGISAIVTKKEQLHKKPAYTVLGVVMIIAWVITRFVSDKTVSLEERDIFLPVILCLLASAYFISKKFSQVNMADLPGKIKSWAPGYYWLIFSLIMLLISCALADFSTLGSAGKFLPFLFFIIIWNVLWYTQEYRSGSKWHNIIPLISLVGLGIAGVEDTSTMAAYLVISLVCSLQLHIHFYGKRSRPVRITPSSMGFVSHWRSLKIPSEITGTFSTVFMSLSAISLGILPLYKSEFSSDFGAHLSIGSVILFVLGCIFMAFNLWFGFLALKDMRKANGGDPGKRYEGAPVLDAFFKALEKKQELYMFLLGFFCLVFIVFFSLICLNFKYFSILASVMILGVCGCMFLYFKKIKRFWGLLIWGLLAGGLVRLLTYADPIRDLGIRITEQTYLYGFVSDVVVFLLCTTVIYFIWKRKPVKINSKFNTISPQLFACLSMIFFISPDGRFGRYLIPLALLITAIKLKDSWSYPVSMGLFLIVYYVFLRDPNPIDPLFYKRSFLLGVMWVMLLAILISHKRLKRDVITAETSIAMTAGIMILAFITFVEFPDRIWLISLIWAVLGGVLIGAGYIYKRTYLRWMGLGVVGIVLTKIAFWDSTQLKLGYRVIVFIAIGLMLLGISYLYFKLREREKRFEGRQEQLIGTYKNQRYFGGR